MTEWKETKFILQALREFKNPLGSQKLKLH